MALSVSWPCRCSSHLVSPFRPSRRPAFGAHFLNRAPDIRIFFTILSGCGRTRSITTTPAQVRRPAPACLRRAGSCAGTGARRCRGGDTRAILSSCCRPRIVSWFSSTVTSIWSCEKPATARVIRRLLRLGASPRRFARCCKEDSRPKPSSTLCRAHARCRRSRAETENSTPLHAPCAKPLSGASGTRPSEKRLQASLPSSFGQAPARSRRPTE